MGVVGAGVSSCFSSSLLEPSLERRLEENLCEELAGASVVAGGARARVEPRRDEVRGDDGCGSALLVGGVRAEGRKRPPRLVGAAVVVVSDSV